MPNINLRDKRNRDAVVRAESIGQSASVRYVDKDGAPSKLRHVLKATSEHAIERLLAEAGDDAALAAQLVKSDSDADIERIGMFLTETSRVYVNTGGEIVYRIVQTEILRGPDGVEKERRPRRQLDPNIESEIPITWTGKLIKKDEAIRRFVFSSKLQIVHVNGLTYDFLHAMAKELAEAQSLMLLGGGKSGKDPLIFRRGATPHRGFLEGRVDGDKYVLLLHLSKLELKRPAIVAVAEATEQAAAAVQAPAPAPVPQPADQVQPLAARKPDVAEVLAATAATPTPAAPVKTDIAETVVAAKAVKQRKTAAAVQAKSAGEGQATEPEAAEKPAAKPRARKAKPADIAPKV